MKKILYFLTVIFFVSIFTSCNNTITRKYGGTTKIALPAGHTLVNVTWKDTDIWVLTKGPDGKFYFHEDSKWGVFEGTVEITENKSPN